MITIGIINIFRGYKNYSLVEKVKIHLVVIGVGISIFLGSVTNLILPLLGNVQFVSFGPYFVLIFIGFTTHALIRYHLFNIRVITTELFTFTIWIFLLVRTLLSEAQQELIVNLSLLVMVVIFGIFLIRSVVKEIKQKEQIEIMAEKVRGAYEVEKKAKEALASLDNVKNQFIMASQHHLRTPLTSMRGYLELLLEGHYGKVSPKIKEILQRFKLSSERLIKIINEFLDISQFQLGKEVIMPKPGNDLEPILKEIIEELHYETDARGLYLKLEKPTLRQAQGKIPKITADSEKLKIALFNIVDNGIKYTKKGGVTITVKRTDAKVQITVKDTGAGISKEEQEGLFERLFERGKEASRLHGTGRGIGLYIAYHIIKAHKGRIWVESEGKDKGSAFFVELPVG